jgi:NAD(P)-dependent dehydrogenase (short-subunit alcohol dehydrogenase family)
MTLDYQRALIVGGSSGVGRELALGLAAKGVATTVIGRNAERLAGLTAANADIRTIACDAAADGAAAGLIRDVAPDLLVLVGGSRPKMAAFHEMDWDDFSATWNNDTKIAWEFTRAAITLPLAAGSTFVSFSSGAALGGSPLSGGYAGAKRMQHFLVNYGQREADRLGLDLRFMCIIPKQLMAGTGIGGEASAAYAEAAGIPVEKFMGQWEKPLTASVASTHLIDLFDAGPENNVAAFALTGVGVEAMP